MGGALSLLMGGASWEEELYWKERREREAQGHRLFVEQQYSDSKLKQQIMEGLESKWLPTFQGLCSSFLQLILIAVLFIAIGYGFYFHFQKRLEYDKLKHQTDMQMQQLSHEASLKQAEMQNKASMQEKELQQNMLLKEKELAQANHLEEKKLALEAYNAERKYRMEIGKLYLDAQKEIMQSNSQHDISRSMTCITQNMLMADQSSDSMQNIAQLSLMNYRDRNRPKGGVRKRHFRSSGSTLNPDSHIAMHSDNDLEQINRVEEVHAGINTPSEWDDDRDPYVVLPNAPWTTLPALVTSEATNSKAYDCWILEFSRNPAELIAAIDNDQQVKEVRERLINAGCSLSVPLNSGCNILLHPEGYKCWLPELQKRNLQKRYFAVSSEMKVLLETIQQNLSRDSKVKIKCAEQLL